MIPISLKLKGIYSYQDKEQIIDFKHLTNAGIFGIFGSVGSGKSTILEAISYALYGETERLNKRENRSYNMMNLKSTNLLIDYIFQIGEDNKEYRFIVKGRRNSKNFDDVKAFNREAFEKLNGKWIPISVNSTEKIIGLNYLNFRRTVIIPQGKFQEFLQLGDTDRTKMMKELFRLERFDLSFKVHAKELENNEKISFLDGELNQLSNINNELLENTNNQILNIEKEFKHKKEELQLVQKEADNLEKLKELFVRIESVTEKYNTIRLNSHKYEIIEKEINNYTYCIQYFKILIENSNRLKSQIRNLNSEIEILNKKISNLNIRKKDNEEKLNKIKPDYDNLDKLKKQSDELEKLLIIKSINEKSKKIKSRIEKGKETIKETSAKIENLRNKKETLKKLIVKIKSEIPDLTILAGIKDWFTNYNHLNNELKNLLSEKENSVQKKSKYNEQVNSLMADVFPKLDNVEIPEYQKLIEKSVDDYELQKSKIEDELKQLHLSESLVKYAQNLENGDACPVCGSLSHPQKLHGKDISEKISKLNSQKDSIINKIKELKSIEKQLSEYQFKIESLIELVNKLDEKISSVNKQIKDFKSQFPVKEKINEDELAVQFKSAKLMQASLINSENELNDVEKELDTEIINKDKFMIAVNKMNNDLISSQSQKTTLISQITNININDSLENTDSKINTEIENLVAKYEFIKSEFENLTENLNITNGELEKNKAVVKTKKSDLDKNKVEHENLIIKLEQQIKLSDFNNEDEVIQILAKSFNVEKLQIEIQEFKQNMFSLKEQLEKLNEQAKNQKYNKETHELVIKTLKEVKNITEQMSKELGSLENDKKTLQKKLLEKDKLQKQYAKLKAREENIASLKSLFKSNGFVNYVSSVYLQNLINSANERFFKLTKQKLQLELTEDNNFEIRDFLNEGKTRSVKTLSGGQTFQASLSLALALADNIQALTKSNNNFFFLDEGFGSLDKESLSVVFSSLKSLRKENRIVGVISHVEDLQQEVETFLNIKNTNEHGSLITNSWT